MKALLADPDDAARASTRARSARTSRSSTCPRRDSMVDGHPQAAARPPAGRHARRRARAPLVVAAGGRDRRARVRRGRGRAARACSRNRVRLRFMSDVPFGAFLSGGIDSSVVVRADGAPHGPAGEDVHDRLRGRARGRDRATRARWPRHIGAEHHEFVVAPDALAILPGLVWHMDEPLADSSALPTWAVSEMARQHVTVVLSGDGGDETFAGYETYRIARLYARADRAAAGAAPLARRGRRARARPLGAALRAPGAGSRRAPPRGDVDRARGGRGARCSRAEAARARAERSIRSPSCGRWRRARPAGDPRALLAPRPDDAT